MLGFFFFFVSQRSETPEKRAWSNQGSGEPKHGPPERVPMVHWQVRMAVMGLEEWPGCLLQALHGESSRSSNQRSPLPHCAGRLQVQGRSLGASAVHPARLHSGRAVLRAVYMHVLLQEPGICKAVFLNARELMREQLQPCIKSAVGGVHVGLVHHDAAGALSMLESWQQGTCQGAQL